LSVKFAVKFSVCLALASCFPLLSAAQQTTPQNTDSSQQPSSTGQPSQAAPQQTTPPAQSQTPAAPAQQPGDKDKSQEKDKPQDPNQQGKVAGTSNDRILYTLPNFLSVQKGHLPPMSAKDKFKVVALGTFDPVEYPWWAVIAAIDQADNSEPAFGQGWRAYAQRYGIVGGDSMVENFMVGAVFPSVLHQDPRFYQSGKGGFFRRTGYSVSRIFVTLGDSGHAQFNFSEVLGSGTAAAISTYTYHPHHNIISTPSNPREFIVSDHTFDNMVDTWGTQLALDTVTIMIKEFWPDIHRKMSRKYRQQSAAPAKQ
jgi:hypothetical protein